MYNNFHSKKSIWKCHPQNGSHFVDFNVFISLAATKQLYDWFSLSVRPSVCLSVCLSHLFEYVPIIVSSWNFQELLPLTEVTSMQKAKVRGQIIGSHGTKNCQFWPKLGVSGLQLKFEFRYDDEMMHRAWWCLGEVLYCFQTVTPVWIHQWLWNAAQSLK